MRKLLRRLEDASKSAKYEFGDFRDHLFVYQDTIEKLSKTLGQINAVEIVTPINLAEAKAKWLEDARIGRWTIPNFQYDEQKLLKIIRFKKDIKKILHSLPKNSNDELDDLIISILKARAESGLRFCNLANSILEHDDDISNHIIRSEYGVPTKTCYKVALKVAKTYRCRSGVNLKHVSKKYSPVDIQNAFQAVCDMENFKANVIIDSKASSVDVRGQGDGIGAIPLIVIPSSRIVSERRLAELIVHELYGHLNTIQSSNTLLGVFGAGRLRSSNDSIYEGYAMHLEKLLAKQYFGENKRDLWPFYTIAIYEAAQLGASVEQLSQRIYDSVKKIKQNEEDALQDVWITLYRTLFRGRTGSGTYVFSKDYFYFSGSLEIEDIIGTEYEYLLRLGEFSPKELIEITSLVKPYYSCRSDSSQRLIEAAMTSFASLSPKNPLTSVEPGFFKSL